jgi:hypothetical protein
MDGKKRRFGKVTTIGPEIFNGLRIDLLWLLDIKMDY